MGGRFVFYEFGGEQSLETTALSSRGRPLCFYGFGGEGAGGDVSILAARPEKPGEREPGRPI
ncbi:hypothetical protein AAU61_05350 [Desulfocarbo indianensis]|nr:hypothetical protein AAU61_05350 [Desulfocarbo indianensis]